MTLCLFPFAIPLTITLCLPETPFNLPLRFFYQKYWSNLGRYHKVSIKVTTLSLSICVLLIYFIRSVYHLMVGKLISLLKSYLFDLFLVKKGFRYDWYIWVAIFRTELRDFARDDLDGLINSHVQKIYMLRLECSSRRKIVRIKWIVK